MHQRSVDAQISHSPNPAIGRCPLPPGEYGLCPRAGDARNIEEKVELRAAARTELLDLEAVMPPEALQALQGVRFMSGRRAAAAATGASGEHYGRLTTAFLDLRLEDCILCSSGVWSRRRMQLFAHRQKGGALRAVSYLSFPSPCVIGLLCSSAPNFIGTLRVTPPFKRKRAVKMLRQCCRNPDQHSKCVPMWTKCWRSRHWPILARSLSVLRPPIAQVSRGGSVAACGGSQKENGTFPKTPVKSLDEAL